MIKKSTIDKLEGIRFISEGMIDTCNIYEYSKVFHVIANVLGDVMEEIPLSDIEGNEDL